MDTIRSFFARQGPVRPRDSRLLGGVCAGVGRRLGLTPAVSRLLFLLLLLVPGSQLLIYPVLWLAMPAEEHVTHPARAAAYPAA